MHVSVNSSARQKQSWYKNTLFVLVADHGHLLPKHRKWFVSKQQTYSHDIVWRTDSSEYRGIQITKLGGHHDLAATLLPQLGLDAKIFMGKNLLVPHAKILPTSRWNMFWDGWKKRLALWSYNRKRFTCWKMKMPALHAATASSTTDKHSFGNLSGLSELLIDFSVPSSWFLVLGFVFRVSELIIKSSLVPVSRPFSPNT